MATIDYKEKYEQALEVAQRFYNNSVAITKKGLEDIFPELAGSEDEKIRKALLNEFIHLQSKGYKFAGLEGEDIISWLEKQGEKAKYHDICDKCVRQPTCQSDCFLQQSEQKPAWSEEDDYNLQCCIAKIQSDIDNGRIGRNRELLTWLKPLKDRVQLQPKQEWSEKDGDILRWTINNLIELKDRFGEEYGKVGDCINWLKSLRPESQWKPSEEQMYSLNWVANVLLKQDGIVEKETSKILDSLYNDLKKLKG